MTLELETVPDATPAEQELDHERPAIHDRAVDAVMTTLHAESAYRNGTTDVLEFLADLRGVLSGVPVKLDLVADRAGELIHGSEATA